MESSQQPESGLQPQPDSKPCYDATTNFSLLGWLWQKLFGRPQIEPTVDLSLEDQRAASDEQIP